MPTAKERLFELIQSEIVDREPHIGRAGKELTWEDIEAAIEELKNPVKKKSKITEKAMSILDFMQTMTTKDNNHHFSAKTIGEGLDISGRSVSGSIRSLVDHELVKKIPGSPVMYTLTEAGKQYQFDKE